MLCALVLRASGPYSPPHVNPQRDDLYNSGKAIYWGDLKIGKGASCAECHSEKDALSRLRLAKVKYNLETRIENCVRLQDRTNGSIEGKQMEALVHYLAKRFRL
jgi:hypothetical protein